jgi:hypothetical protein
MKLTPRKRKQAATAFLVMWGALSPSLSHPAISFTDLHPAEAGSSEGYAVSSSREAGDVRFPSGALVAALWSGTPESFVNLNPSWAFASICRGLSDSQAVGHASFFLDGGTVTHAAMWNGTAESCIDLHPVWADPWRDSEAFSTSGSAQVGQVDVPGSTIHAALWNGTPEGCVDLHPGTTSSASEGVAGPRQGGYTFVLTADFHAPHHAAVWEGSPGTWTDLHPDGWDESLIYAVTTSREVGSVGRGSLAPPEPGVPYGYITHAAMWSGTRQSFVDMHPPGATGLSELYGACDRWQVGLAVINGAGHAGLWSSTPESFVDLHTILGTNYDNSFARAVWTDGMRIRVIGTATLAPSRTEHAVLWEITEVPASWTAVRLAVSCEAGRLVLRWPSNSDAFSVERATSLILQDWGPVAEQPALLNGQWVVSLPMGDASGWYRLKIEEAVKP